MVRRVPLLVVATLLAAACGSSEHHYVKSLDDGVFLKVPADWEVYDEREFWDAQDLSDREVDDRVANGFLVAFDSAPRPSMDHVAALVPDHVTGVLSVRPLDAEQRDSMSLATLRSVVFDLDTALDDGSARLIDYEELDLDDGFRGVHVVFEYDTEDGPAVFDQITAHDAGLTKLYTFVQSCSSACYETEAEAMDDVAATWTLRAP